MKLPSIEDNGCLYLCGIIACIALVVAVAFSYLYIVDNLHGGGTYYATGEPALWALKISIPVSLLWLLWFSNVRRKIEAQELMWLLDEPRGRQIAEERKQRIAEREQLAKDLLAKEDILHDTRIQNTMVVCSNGHRYLRKDFYFQRAESWVSYEPADDGNEYNLKVDEVEHIAYNDIFGCPLCKSTLCKYENLPPKRYRKCKSHACPYWYNEAKYSDCPVCAFEI